MIRRLYSAAQVRSLEARLAGNGLSASILMSRAGDALLRCVRVNWPEARRICIVTGPGNNGGDGYVLARLLGRFEAIDVSVVALAAPVASEARSAADAWLASGRTIDPWRRGDALPEADLIVDALFGVGLSRALADDARRLVDAINAHPAPVLAVDVPSGLIADTGACDGAVIKATRTLCLLARKRGLHTGRAVDLTGALTIDDLGTSDTRPEPGGPGRGSGDESPNAIATDPSSACLLLDRADLRRWLPRRRRAAHKGDNGHALVIGGDAGMAGAVAIAGHAALRAGAGWVSIATHDAHAALVAASHPELLRHGVEDAGALEPVLARADAVAIGPGLGTGSWSRMLLDATLNRGVPLVLDADALNLLAGTTRRLGPDAVLTPHPGEAARLLARSTDAIERDRFAAARDLAARFDCVVVLKGAGTIVDDGDRCVVCPYGNPGMASGGMGDALSGIIVAFMAQGMSAWDAAVAGVLAHALAGDDAARAGERGMVASDLIERLRGVVNP